jgi:metacaspase-1
LDYIKGDKVSAAQKMMKGLKLGVGSKLSNAISKETRASAADVVSFSGCKDNQTSADTVEGGQATGALSWVSKVRAT